MKVKQLRTEYVQAWSVSRCLLLEIPPKKSVSLLSEFVFCTVNAFLEGDRSWWKPFIFLDEAGFKLAKTWRRAWECQTWICHVRWPPPDWLTQMFSSIKTSIMMWMRTDRVLTHRDRVDKNIEVRWGTLQLTLYCRSKLFFLSTCCEFIISSIIFTFWVEP